MTREQLAAWHAAVIRKHFRTLDDHGGRPGEQLLTDLAEIADKHAEDRAAEAAADRPAAKRRRTTDQ